MIQVGAWSLASGRPLTHLSTPASTSAGSNEAFRSRWSMRRPELVCQ